MPSRLRTTLELALFLIGTFVPMTLLALNAAEMRGFVQAGGIACAGILSPMTSAFLVRTLVAQGPVVKTGWRSFLNARLQHLFGRAGLIVGGAIWGLRHLPFALLAPADPHHPWMGLMASVPFFIVLNFLLADGRGKTLVTAAAVFTKQAA